MRKRRRRRRKKAWRTWRSCSAAWPSAATRQTSASSPSPPRPSTKPWRCLAANGEPFHKLHHAAGHRGRVHPRRAQELHHLRHLLQTAQGVRGRSERRAQEGRARAGPLHAPAPPQHRAEDRGHGRALQHRHPPQDRRPGQGDGGDRLPPGGGPLQTEFRPLHRGEGLPIKRWWPFRAPCMDDKISRQDLHRRRDEQAASGRRSCRRSSPPPNTRSCWSPKNTRPASTSRSCTRCTWTSASPAFRRCKRSRG